jgi:hypothetical protein
VGEKAQIRAFFLSRSALSLFSRFFFFALSRSYFAFALASAKARKKRRRPPLAKSREMLYSAKCQIPISINECGLATLYGPVLEHYSLCSLRTSETNYLNEAFSFYAAIRGRAYYNRPARDERYQGWVEIFT